MSSPLILPHPQWVWAKNRAAHHWATDQWGMMTRSCRGASDTDASVRRCHGGIPTSKHPVDRPEPDREIACCRRYRSAKWRRNPREPPPRARPKNLFANKCGTRGCDLRHSGRTGHMRPKTDELRGTSKQCNSFAGTEAASCQWQPPPDREVAGGRRIFSPPVLRKRAKRSVRSVRGLVIRKTGTRVISGPLEAALLVAFLWIC